MTKEIMFKRIKAFVIQVVAMTNHLNDTKSSQVISSQVLRSSTAVGANYRAACRSKSKRDFINKLKIVEEELDETLYWLDLVGDLKLIRTERLGDLKNEGDELLSIIVTSLKTAKERLNMNL